MLFQRISSSPNVVWCGVVQCGLDLTLKWRTRNHQSTEQLRQAFCSERLGKRRKSPNPIPLTHTNTQIEAAETPDSLSASLNHLSLLQGVVLNQNNIGAYHSSAETRSIHKSWQDYRGFGNLNTHTPFSLPRCPPYGIPYVFTLPTNTLQDSRLLE